VQGPKRICCPTGDDGLDRAADETMEARAVVRESRTARRPAAPACAPAPCASSAVR